MNVSPRGAPAAGQRAPVKTAVLRSSWNRKFYCGMRLFACEFVPIAKTISKAISVVDTSTKNFVVWKTSAGIFPRAIIQHPISGAVKCRAGNCRAHGA
jgi:hypothetical protein